MYQSGQVSYRAAFDTALADLEQICDELRYMRTRKDKIEAVLQALKPLVDPVENQPQAYPQPTSVPVVEPEMDSNQAPASPLIAANLSSDPIQKRIDSVLGLAVA